MHLFERSNKLFDIVNANYDLLPVINRFGIRLGFKDKTVTEVCDKHQIHKDFFLALINTYNNPNYFPETELIGFSPLLIIDYLRRTHDYYVDYFLPKIEMLLAQLISGSTEGYQELKMIDTFYKKYKNELLLHINDEEKNVFPYVIRLVEDRLYSDDQYTIRSFEKEHLNVEDKLNDLKNLIIKYITPSYKDNDCNEFLITLYRFEKDIKDHARIEDKILFQQVVAIEKQLKK